jgi:thiamine-phosphate pyrophosphorylase
MLLCAITDGSAGGDPDLRPQLLRRAEHWTSSGVHFIQLREKALTPAGLASLAKEIQAKLNPKHTRLLINLPSPEHAHIAVASGAGGVHLAGKPRPGVGDTVRQAFRVAGREAILSLPCHTLEEVALATNEQADLILFSPVFEKLTTPPQGLAMLHKACSLAGNIPVLALGGVTPANAPACIAAGAAGIAGIRLFAEGSWRQLARQTEPIEPYIVE